MNNNVEQLLETQEVVFFGVSFTGMLRSNGEIVYSARKAAEGLSIPISSFLNSRHKILDSSTNLNFSINRRKVSAKLTQDIRTAVKNSRETDFNYGGNTLLGISKAELVCWMLACAEIGVPKWSAIADAGLATLFSMAEDKAFNKIKTVEEYQFDAISLQRIIEEKREKLRIMSGQVTNPLLACNVYKANNELIYGGCNRNSYSAPDAGVKHRLTEIAELMQAGAKIGGSTVEEAIHKVHSYLQENFADIL
jgi:hypothetical protein